MSAKRENGLGKGSAEKLRVCDAFAGETPALPANRSTETLNAYEYEKVPKKERQQSHSLQTARIDASGISNRSVATNPR
jgi:hypothetical protein